MCSRSERVCAHNRGSSVCLFLQSTPMPLIGISCSLLLLLRDVRSHSHRQRRDFMVTFGWCCNPPSTRNLPLREDSETPLPSGEGSWLWILGRDSCPQAITHQEACSPWEGCERGFSATKDATWRWHFLLADSNTSWRELAFAEPTLSCLALHGVQTLKRQGGALCNF